MKVKYNAKTLKIQMELEEKDFYDSIQIEEMIRGHFQCRKCGSSFESKGWEILKGYFNSARELLIESGKQGTSSRVQRALADLKFAKLDGFDYAVNLPERIIMQADQAREAIKKQEEIRHAADE